MTKRNSNCGHITENRNKRIRYNLKVAVNTRDHERLPGAMEEFRNAKLPDDDKDYEKGERLMKEWQARDGKDMLNRNMKAKSDYLINLLHYTKSRLLMKISVEMMAVKETYQFDNDLNESTSASHDIFRTSARDERA